MFGKKGLYRYGQYYLAGQVLSAGVASINIPPSKVIDFTAALVFYKRARRRYRLSNVVPAMILPVFFSGLTIQ